jgi:hypothetical protein
MSDVFREVDEDLRREQIKKLWERFGSYVIAVAILIVVGTAGYRGWQYWQERRAEANGDRFVAALKLASDGKHDDAQAALAAIIKDGSGGYPVLARLRAAGEKATAGDDKGAVADYDAIAATGAAPRLIKDLARLRAALILVESASAADLESRVGALAAAGNPWRQSAREILGLAAWRLGDLAGARKYFNDIASDQATSQSFRSRAQLMLALIDARQGKPAAEAPKPAEPPKPAG